MILDPRDTEACSCGSYGCLERLVSIARLRKRISTDPPPAAERKERKAAPEEIPLRLLFSTFELTFDIYIIIKFKEENHISPSKTKTYEENQYGMFL